jgi:hypothetical protein
MSVSISNTWVHQDGVSTGFRAPTKGQVRRGSWLPALAVQIIIGMYG